MLSDRPRCGVLGDPIRHSLSPLLHRAAYAALGLDWTYDAHRVSADELAGFVAGLDPHWRGLSLTMPLKQVAGQLCTDVEPVAAQLRAVNTMVRTDAGWRGANTDVGGCVDAVRAAGLDTMLRGLVVGAGATAASALAAMADLGAREALVLARSTARAEWLVPLGAELGVEVTTRGLDEPEEGPNDEGADLLVSTIPASAQPAYADRLGTSARMVFDVVYDPPMTPLLRAAAVAGARVVPGLDLLLYQAARQVVLMTGVDEAPIDAMRHALAPPR